MTFVENLQNMFLSNSLIAIFLIAGGVIFILCLSLLAWWIFYKRKWNLLVEFKMIRSDGRVIIPEWGKGFYDKNQGVIWLKRKFKTAEPVKAKDIRNYLQGASTVTAIGNPGNWKLVIPESFFEVEDEETGEKAAVMEIKTDTREDKPWAVQHERSAKATFTIHNFLQEYGHYLGWGFILLVIIIGQFIGFSLVLQNVK